MTFLPRLFRHPSPPLPRYGETALRAWELHTEAATLVLNRTIARLLAARGLDPADRRFVTSAAFDCGVLALYEPTAAGLGPLEAAGALALFHRKDPEGVMGAVRKYMGERVEYWAGEASDPKEDER